MATATATQSNKAPSKKKTRYIGKPTGVIQGRVETAGPSRFAVISVDCAKRRSKWMICDFFGKVIVEPTDVQHDAGSLSVMCGQVKEALRQHNIVDSIAAVEMTGVYHRPVQRALRKAGLDTRTVHPFASKHYRKVLHPDLKTDDNDLEAIFHAAINGYGLASLPVDANYQSLQSLARHRGNLVKQRSRLQVQIRTMMHQCMPGYDELFAPHKFFKESVAMPVAEKFSSAKTIDRTGVDGIAKYLKKQKVRSHRATLEKIVAWSKTAAEPTELATMMTEQWRGLSELRKAIDKQIVATEQEMARFLVKTPYVLMLSIRGINVVSASTLAGEAGPIEHYASARAINGRAGLFPSRYQSDTVDSQGRLSRGGNRRLRAAAMMVATNLIKCHPYYRGLNSFWDQRNIDARDRHCRIANRAMRMVFQLVGGRQVWRGRGVDADAILSKLRTFHHEHQTPLDRTIADLNEALAWLPKKTYSAESKPLVEFVNKKRRGAQPIRDLLIGLLIRLGVDQDKALGLNPSEAPESSH